MPKSTGNVKGPPQVVEVAIKVSSLENIDVKGNSVTIKGFLQFAWNDVDPPAKVIQAAKGTKLAGAILESSSATSRPFVR